MRIVTRFATIAPCAILLFCSGLTAHAQLPDPFEGIVTLNVEGGPITFAESRAIEPGGVTIRFQFGDPFTITGGPLNFDYLVVGGGGGGGTSTAFSTAGSGGGGAGGVVEGTVVGATGTLMIAVGVGGDPGAIGNNSGSNGGNSYLDGIIALGGGGGAGGNASGLAGGSGGGGRGSSTTGGAALQPGSPSGGLGFAGGTGTGSEGGGGGGGAGSAGGNAAGDNGGSGGLGFESSISGASQFYGAGGGGGGRSGGTPGSGGSGIGGSGANNGIDATAGVDGTGSGGGGGNNSRQGAAGGSGIVIISYAGPQAATGGTITTSGGNTIHTFDTPTPGEPVAILSGNLSGSGSLTFDNAGRLVLSGTNSYSGGTTVSRGTLQINSVAALPGSGTHTVNTGATLQLNSVNSMNYSQILAGTGRVLLNMTTTGGNHNTQLNGNNTGFTGLLELTGSGNNKLNTSGLNLNPDATIRINPGAQLFLSGGATVANDIQVSGTGNGENRGAIRLTNGNITGNITLLGNTTFGPEGATISGNITSGAAGTQTLTLGTSNSNGSLSISGSISDGTGTIALVKTSNSIVTLSGNSTYQGNTFIGLGTLRIEHDNALGGTDGYTYVGTANASGDGTDGKLALAGNITSAEPIRFYGNNNSGAAATRIVNAGGTNELTGGISLHFGGGHYGISSETGHLTVTGDIVRGG